MEEITVYTSQSCPWCTRVKSYFAEKGVPYREVDVNSDFESAQRMVELTGQRAVPVITKPLTSAEAAELPAHVHRGAQLLPAACILEITGATESGRSQRQLHSGTAAQAPPFEAGTHERAAVALPSAGRQRRARDPQRAEPCTQLRTEAPGIAAEEFHVAFGSHAIVQSVAQRAAAGDCAVGEAALSVVTAH